MNTTVITAITKKRLLGLTYKTRTRGMLTSCFEFWINDIDSYLQYRTNRRVELMIQDWNDHLASIPYQPLPKYAVPVPIDLPKPQLVQLPNIELFAELIILDDDDSDDEPTTGVSFGNPVFADPDPNLVKLLDKVKGLNRILSDCKGFHPTHRKMIAQVVKSTAGRLLHPQPWY